MLVNNGLYRGPGTSDRLLDLRMADLDTLVRGNVSYQIRLVQLVLPSMLAQGGGGSSTSCRVLLDGIRRDRRERTAGASRTQARRRLSVASPGGINAEFAGRGIEAFNVDPGNVVTERRRALRPDDEYSAEFGTDSAAATAGVVAWLATDPGSRVDGSADGCSPPHCGRSWPRMVPSPPRCDRRRPPRARFAEASKGPTATGDR